MRYLVFLLLMFLMSCKSCPINNNIIPLQRLQIVEEPLIRLDTAIDCCECCGLYKNALKKCNNNIEEFLKIYNQQSIK